MSLRRFTILLRNLSGASATVAHMNSTTWLGGRREPVALVEGAANVERSLEMLYKK